jgi:hypothetical protein
MTSFKHIAGVSRLEFCEYNVLVYPSSETARIPTGTEQRTTHP